MPRRCRRCWKTVQATRNEDADVREIALRALARIGDTRAVEPLVAALKAGRKLARPPHRRHPGAPRRPGHRSDHSVPAGHASDTRLAPGPPTSWVSSRPNGRSRTGGLPQGSGRRGPRQGRRSPRQTGRSPRGHLSPRPPAVGSGALCPRPDRGCVGKFADHEVIDRLVRALGDPAWWVRMRSVEALEQIGAAAEAPLAVALDDPDPEIRIRAAVALERLGVRPGSWERSSGARRPRTPRRCSQVRGRRCARTAGGTPAPRVPAGADRGDHRDPAGRPEGTSRRS